MMVPAAIILEGFGASLRLRQGLDLKKSKNYFIL